MSQTKAEQAYQEIKGMIIRTELAPGAVINEMELMDQLGFGRTPIREALKRLQSDHLVVVKPRRGIFVSELAITDLTQIFEIRVELEALAVRLACQRITEDELLELKNLVDQIAKTDWSQKDALILLDQQFHSLIRESSQNRFLITSLEYCYNLSMRIWYLALPQAAETFDAKVLKDIYQAIASGDEELAVTHITQHIKDFQITIKNYL